MTPLITELSYHPDSAILFNKIAHKPWAMFLDSGLSTGNKSPQAGRYDIMVADPVITLTTRGDLTEIIEPTGSHISREDPFGLVRDFLGRQPEPQGDLPFMGGAVGYFGYDLARRLEHLPDIAQDDEQLPEMQIGIYDWAVIVDHQRQRTFLASYGRAPWTRQHWGDLVALLTAQEVAVGGTFKVTSPVTANMDQSAYAQAFSTIQRYILEGDCYQVNLAQRFKASAEGDAWQAYRILRTQSPAPFSAFLNLPQMQVVSASPERFLQLRRGLVETRPIKGTRPRSADPVQDQAYAQQLRTSAKDRAENLMIVDLLRNDIGKNCMPGSVRAERMFELESFANVHHLVSTVTGRLAPGHTALHLLRGAFPGGSITGAPKLRAMQIIEELEPHRRGVYCGAIGYIGFDGNMDTSIAIRTAVYSHGSMRFYAGGGIVADSQCDKEYLETLDKAANMLELAKYFYRDI
jgi:para-aminobenzoate synthetase component 1